MSCGGAVLVSVLVVIGRLGDGAEEESAVGSKFCPASSADDLG